MHMREQLERRLASLRSEYEAGQKQVAELESRLAGLRTTLERIRGAIQILEEQLAQPTIHPSQ
jgi:septal ring factor EnvC (AmiA/AmiB activator)